MRKIATPLALILAAGCVLAAPASNKVSERLNHCAIVIDEIMGAPDKGLPQDLLDKAVCVGVVPAEKTFAFGVGGSYGRGALVAGAAARAPGVRPRCSLSAREASAFRSAANPPM